MGRAVIPDNELPTRRAARARRTRSLTRAQNDLPARLSEIHRRGMLLRNRSRRFAAALSLLAFGVLPITSYSQQNLEVLPQSQPNIQNEANRDKTCKIIYLGLVGGTEPSNNPHSGVVQLRDAMRGPNYPEVCAKTFSPYFWRSGFHWILTHFPSHSGPVTNDELGGAPKVILVGHSLGGWGVLSVARKLNTKGIPVELCVQIDSVGITDHTVPRNVKAAAIFHANDAMFLLTTKKIKLEDPTQTKFMESVLVKGAGHWSITRDPRIRDLVLCTVETLGSDRGHVHNCPSGADPRRSVLSTNPQSAHQ
jgi:hypothetical protein